MGNDQISDEAAEWFVALRCEQSDIAVQQQFMRWLRQSPEHVRAYLDIVSLWGDLPAVEAVKKLDPDACFARVRRENNVVPFQVVAATTTDSMAPRSGGTGLARPQQRAAWLKKTRLRIAACVAIVAAGLGALSWWGQVSMPTYTTEVGEQRILQLPDGSRVELNSRSRIRVRFTAKERAIELMEGQALFLVAKEPQRVFVVKTGAAQVRAVGTQFDVYRKQGGTVITVVEGRVAVSPVAQTTAQHARQPLSERAAVHPSGQAPSTAAPRPPQGRELTHSEVLLSAGEQVLVAGSSTMAPTAANVAAVTSWTHGALMFTSEPLSSVVEEFNRYNTQRIVLDGLVEDFPITATFSSTDPHALIEFLKGQSELRVERRGGEYRIFAVDRAPTQN